MHVTPDLVEEIVAIVSEQGPLFKEDIRVPCPQLGYLAFRKTWGVSHEDTREKRI